MPDRNAPGVEGRIKQELARMKAAQQAEFAAWKRGEASPQKGSNTNAVKKTRQNKSVGKPKRGLGLFKSRSNGKSFGKHR